MLATERQHVTVAAPFGMILQPVFGQVVHRDGFNRNVEQGFLIAIFEHRRLLPHVLRQFLGHCCRSHDHRFVLTDGTQSLGIEMIAMNIGDEDEVGLRKIREGLPASHRIDIDRLSIPSHDKRSVIDRMDDQIAVFRTDVVTHKIRAGRWCDGQH